MQLDFFLAITIFVLSYGIIISEKIHRTVVAFFGAALLVLLGVLTQEQALEGVDFNTLGLLVGMMVIVGIAKNSGIFQYIAIWAAKKAKGNPVKIFIALGLITAIFSAFLDNVTTVLFIVPVAFVIAHNLKINPKPFLFSSILLSNIGGTATLIGDPPNILIGSAAHISFIEFIVHLGPIVVIITALTLLAFYFMYRKVLVTTPEDQAKIMAFNPADAITDKSLMIKSLVVMILTIIGFFTHTITHIEAATIAIGGAAFLLFITFNEPEEYIRDIEWSTIFFFIGLFILVTGMEHVGVIAYLAQKLIEMTGGNFTVLTLAILWLSAIFSAIVDNIPLVATMIPLIQDIGTLSGVALGPLWWALALGADLGGNATIVGASANVVVSGMAEKDGHKIGFFEYIKTAVPLTLGALILATGYVYLRYL